jgi:DNA-binding winged helix-turn-helix (wHTH) protein
MAFIEIEKGIPEDLGKKFVLDEKAVQIGRIAPGNEPDIALSDEYVSRRHAEISFRQNSYNLRDLHSTNGTSIDQIRLEPGRFYPLKDESLIGLGLVAGGPRIALRFKMTPTVSTTRYDPETPAENAIFGWLLLDESKNEIRVDARPVTLSRKEYDLIVCLYKNADKVCHRDEIITAVWPEVIDPGGISNAAIDQLIHRVRLKIEADPTQPRRLISLKGFGYRLYLK